MAPGSTPHALSAFPAKPRTRRSHHSRLARYASKGWTWGVLLGAIKTGRTRSPKGENRRGNSLTDQVWCPDSRLDSLRDCSYRDPPVSSSPSDHIVVAFTGASGSAYGVRLVEVLLSQGATVHLVISPAANQVFARELELSLAGQLTAAKLLSSVIPWWKERAEVPSDIALGQLLTHGYQDYNAGIASGSFPTSGMVICPCSMGTLASVAQGMSTNLIQRAADVHLKERRKLIVVPRETPLGLIQLENMRRLTEAGGVVLPAMPGLYHQPLTIMDLVDFVVTRICDQLGRPVKLTRRWGMDEA